MKYGVRLASSVCLATSVVFCLSVVFYSTAHAVTPVHAQRVSTTGSISSSPTSGPVGATISVSGSGWSEPDGEQVSLGYMIATYCTIVSDAQASTFKNGSFSGSLHLPNGTPLGTYSICATFGSTTAAAITTYTVLTESSPQISISLAIQAGAQYATITGSNYFPAGTTVNLFWKTTNGSVIFTISPAVSNNNGLISRIFIVPTTIASGSFKIVANVAQQPTLSSSVTFTYNAITPTPTPSPSPTPLPASDPTPTQHPSPTAVVTAGATPILTPTVAATALVGSQNTNTGQTPTSGTTSNDSNTNQSIRIVLIGSIIGVLALLATILFIALFIRHKKARSTDIVATVGPTQSSPMSWQNYQFGSTPYPVNNGSIAVSPYTHLLQQPEGGSSGLTSEPTIGTQDDPDIESIKRQVQMGLFATTGNRRDD